MLPGLELPAGLILATGETTPRARFQSSTPFTPSFAAKYSVLPTAFRPKGDASPVRLIFDTKVGVRDPACQSSLPFVWSYAVKYSVTVAAGPGTVAKLSGFEAPAELRSYNTGVPRLSAIQSSRP